MPRQPVEHYYSEKEPHEMVDRINAFSSEYAPWKFTQARKEHQDLFGEVIKRGDHYFKYGRGPAFDNVVKQSAFSMERLCFVSAGLKMGRKRRFENVDGRHEKSG